MTERVVIALACGHIALGDIILELPSAAHPGGRINCDEGCGLQEFIEHAIGSGPA